MGTTMRAKMRVNNVQTNKDAEGAISNEVLHFQAVAKNGAYPADGSDEDNTFARWTPNATVMIQITNSNLFGKFEVDQAYYIDFTPVVGPVDIVE